MLAIDWQAEMNGEDMEIRLLMDRPTPFEVLYLSNPNRIIIEMPETSFGFDRAQTQPTTVIENMRYGAFDEETSRIVLSLSTPMIIQNLPEDTAGLFDLSDKGAALTLLLQPSPQDDFSALALEQLAKSTAPVFAPKTDRIGDAPSKQKNIFSVVIDPGHGGIDTGADGLHGTKEKHVTLAFAQVLKNALAGDSRLRVTLTRDSDQFIRLKERVRIARQHEADLFISIHADTIQYQSIFGATVYTLSEKASDQISAKIAQQANNADLFAGVTIDEEDEDVADILVDLLRDETDIFSVNFAQSLVAEFSGQKIRMIKNPHRRASFQVLSAPDVPSVLLELGYLSNNEDEKRLMDPNWRQSVAETMAVSIKKFAGQVLASRIQ